MSKVHLKKIPLGLMKSINNLDDPDTFIEQLSDVYDEETISLCHKGTKRHSGRYKWGTGENPFQHENWDLFKSKMKSLNGDESLENIQKVFGADYTAADYKKYKQLYKNVQKRNLVDQIKNLKEKGTAQNGWQPMGNTEIARYLSERTGKKYNESTIRSLIANDEKAGYRLIEQTALDLKEIVDEKGMVDVGKGVEQSLGIPRTRLDSALFALEVAGYHIYKNRIEQSTNKDQRITQTILTVPDKEYKDVYDTANVHSLLEYKASGDDEKITAKEKLKYPISLDSSRVEIRYKEDGGIDRDGTIELRKGVDDISLQDSTGNGRTQTYAQVRILVDGDRYLKGMAIYGDDLPKGKDVVFYTNKSKGTPLREVLKETKDDPNDPFGSLISEQNYYISKDGTKKQGVINYRAAEGSWEDWSNALPAQFLSKQSKKLAKQQLGEKEKATLNEYKSIMEINNPTIRKYYLNKFAEQCDANAVELKAAALPGQKYQVMIAIPTLKNTEVYAPNFEHGTKLALIRFPHGGTFEIPILTVNNRNKDAKKILGTNPLDAVGVNSKVAEQLSGADYDGDTVMCIPTHDDKGKVRISNRAPLEGLIGFDPKISYGYSKKETVLELNKETGKKEKVTHYYDEQGDEYPLLDEAYKQKQMGIVSNLISDMTLANATPDELERAVKHSMCVIDATKHHLNYKKSEAENDIKSLKIKYQNGGGVSTLITRAKSEYSEPKTQGSPKINIKGRDYYDPSKPEGALIYKLADDLYYPKQKYNKETGLTTIYTEDGKKITYNKKNPSEAAKYNPTPIGVTSTGKPKYGEIITNADGTITYKTKMRTQRTTKMAATDDARTLYSSTTSPYEMEVIYGDYANYMKSMANQARKEYATTKGTGYNPTAAKVYAKERSSLMVKVNNAVKNAPIEREAQRLTISEVNSKIAKAEKAGNPLSNDDIKKASQKALTKYRQELGSVSRRDRYIPITDNEWEAIQAGAIAESTLNTILNNTDPDDLRERATPGNKKEITNAIIARIQSMSNQGLTNSDIAIKLGISTSTVSKYLKGE